MGSMLPYIAYMDPMGMNSEKKNSRPERIPLIRSLASVDVCQGKDQLNEDPHDLPFLRQDPSKIHVNAGGGNWGNWGSNSSDSFLCLFPRDQQLKWVMAYPGGWTSPMFKTTIRGVNLQISPGQQETHWGKERNWTVPEDWNETFQQDVFQRFNVDLPSTNGPKWFVEIVHEHQWEIHNINPKIQGNGCFRLIHISSGESPESIGWSNVTNTRWGSPGHELGYTPHQV